MAPPPSETTGQRQTVGFPSPNRQISSKRDQRGTAPRGHLERPRTCREESAEPMPDGRSTAVDQRAYWIPVWGPDNPLIGEFPWTHIARERNIWRLDLIGYRIHCIGEPDGGSNRGTRRGAGFGLRRMELHTGRRPTRIMRWPIVFVLRGRLPKGPLAGGTVRLR